jgi:hypothetical protein
LSLLYDASPSAISWHLTPLYRHGYCFILSFFTILVVVASSSVEAEALRGSADNPPDSFGFDLVPS